MANLGIQRLDHRERRRLNLEMPLSEQAVNEVYVERIREFVDSLAEAEELLSSPAYWLYHPEGTENCEDYCLQCVEKEVDRLNAEHLRKRIAEGKGEEPGPQERDEDVRPWNAEGGCDREEGLTYCEKCGSMLDFYHDESGMGQEIEHWLELKPDHRIGNATEAIELARMLEAMEDLGPMDNEIIARCLELIGLVDMTAVHNEVEARRNGSWARNEPEREEIAIAA